MSPLKQLALASWYYGTWPYRHWAAARDARCGRAPVAVLFYHRVADAHLNDWTITRRDFAAHVAYLKKHFDLISLADAQSRIASGQNARPAVSLTFDDGYAENCEFALPLLARENIPCTYFVTLENALSGRPFPHDVARGAPCPPNTIAQLRDLASVGVEIGAHTRTHANLGPLTDPDSLYDETIAAGAELGAAIGSPVRYFAFPYGLPQNLNALSIAMLRHAGYVGVCSAYGDYNWPGDDSFHIKRIHADPELLRLANWLSVDPRKRRAARHITTQVQPLFAASAGAAHAHQPCEVSA